MISTTFYEMKESVKIHNFSTYFKLSSLLSYTSPPCLQLVILSANGLQVNQSRLSPTLLSPLSQQLKVTILVQSSLFKTRVTLRPLTPPHPNHPHLCKDPTVRSPFHLLLRSNSLQSRHSRRKAIQNLRQSDQLYLHLGSQLVATARSPYSFNYYWMEEALMPLSFSSSRFNLFYLTKGIFSL